MSVREKWSLRYVVGPRSIQNTDEYLCKFSVSRGGVEKQKTKNKKTETQTKMRRRDTGETHMMAHDEAAHRFKYT